MAFFDLKLLHSFLAEIYQPKRERSLH